jgi:hypothetical protein
MHDMIHVPVKVLTNKFRPPRMAGFGAAATTTFFNNPSYNQATNTITDASKLASVGTAVAAVASGIAVAAGAGAAAGASIGPIGAAVGAALGIIGSFFGPAKEGQAAQTWDNLVQEGYLFNTTGTAFDERYLGEAMKGAMDENGNSWIGCGSNGYKNPDCFYAPLAQQIISAYKSGKIPLSAQVPQIVSTVVMPWVQSGAGGLFRWGQGKGMIPTNYLQALLTVVTDRYVNGLPITRANMPSYASQSSNYAAWSTPSITVALASQIAAAKAAATAAPAAQPKPINAVISKPVTATAAPTPVVAPAPVASPINPVTTTPAPTAATPVASPTVPSGYGYNYAGGLVPIPAGYSLNAQNYIIDAAGNIFGSPGDIAYLTPAATPVTSVAQSPINPVIVTTPSAAPVASTDYTPFLILGGIVALAVVMGSKKK